MRNHADSEADFDRFCKRVAETEVVYFLDMGSRAVSVHSDEFEDDEGNSPAVLLFYSDAAYARRAQKKHFNDSEVTELSLFSFMYRWLPGMTGDGCLAGPNWSADLTGFEVEPFELRGEIKRRMSMEAIAAHEAEYHRLSAQET